MKPAGLECWEFVERGLRIIQRRCKPIWTIDYVKQSIGAGHAGLFVCESGFLILEIDSESGHKYLNAWLGWFRPNYAKEHRQELLSFLDAKKTELGCEWVQFASPREGWLGVEPDFQKVMTIWRRA